MADTLTESLITSNEETKIIATINNPDGTDKGAFSYAVNIPQNGDTAGPDGASSEWTARLKSTIDVSALPAGTVALYSTDGQTFGPAPADLGTIKAVQVNFPSVPKQSVFTVEIPLLGQDMNGNPDYNLDAYAKSGYLFNGTTYNLGSKKIILKDKIAPTGSISYSTVDPTNGDVTVTLTTSEAINVPSGWTKVDDTHYTKVVSANMDEPLSVDLNDNSGNTGTPVEYNVTNIDKKAPFGMVSYSETDPTSGDVTVTMETSEPIATPSGWTKVDDTHFTKTVSENESGNVTITDLAGNTKEVPVSVQNIDKEAPT